jgi:hypothetical protein
MERSTLDLRNDATNAAPISMKAFIAICQTAVRLSLCSKQMTGFEDGGRFISQTSDVKDPTLDESQYGKQKEPHVVAEANQAPMRMRPCIVVECTAVCECPAIVAQACSSVRLYGLLVLILRHTYTTPCFLPLVFICLSLCLAFQIIYSSMLPMSSRTFMVCSKARLRKAYLHDEMLEHIEQDNDRPGSDCAAKQMSGCLHLVHRAFTQSLSKTTR